MTQGTTGLEPDRLTRFDIRSRSVWRRLAQPELILAALMLAMFVAIIVEGHGTTFSSDEFDFISDRSGGGSFVHELLRADQDYFVLVPALIYKALFATVGLEPYWPYRVVGALTHLLCAGLAWKLVKPRIGRWPGLVAVTPLVFLGAAGEDILWPFEIAFMGSVASGLGALLALDRGTRRANLVAAALLCVSIACSPAGVPFIIAVAVRVAVARVDLHRLWVPAPALLIYGVWYLAYAEGTFKRGNLVLAPGWALDAFGAATGAVLGSGIDWGRPLALIVALLVAWRLGQPGPPPARLLSYLALGVSFWVLVPLGRAEVPPGTSRYLYLGAFAVVLILAEVAAGRSFRPRLVAIAGAVAAAAAVLGLGQLHILGATFRTKAKDTLPQLGALALAPIPPPPGYQLNVLYVPRVRAGPYLKGVRRIGDSPAPGPNELASSGSATGRAKADRVLVDFGVVRLLPDQLGRGAAPPPARTRGGRIARRGGCLRVEPTATSAQPVIEFGLPPAGARLRSDRGDARVGARRFGGSYAAVGRVPHGEARVLRAVRDASPAPWIVKLSGAGPISICSVR